MRKEIIKSQVVPNREACGKTGDFQSFIYVNDHDGGAGIGFNLKEEEGGEFSAHSGVLNPEADETHLWRAKRLLEIVPVITGGTLKNCYLAAGGDKMALKCLRDEARALGLKAEFHGKSVGAGSDFDWFADDVLRAAPSRDVSQTIAKAIYDHESMTRWIVEIAGREPWYGNNLA